MEHFSILFEYKVDNIYITIEIPHKVIKYLENRISISKKKIISILLDRHMYPKNHKKYLFGARTNIGP